MKNEVDLHGPGVCVRDSAVELILRYLQRSHTDRNVRDDISLCQDGPVAAPLGQVHMRVARDADAEAKHATQR